MSLTKAATLLAVGAMAAGCMRSEDRAVISQMDGDSVVAPSAEAARQEDRTLVRVIHAVPGAPSVDVKAGEGTVFNAVAFKSVTPYQYITDNRPHISMRPTGEATGAPLAENTDMVMDGAHYTVVAIQDENGGLVELEAIRDDLTPSDPNKARIRVINAAPRANDVNITAQANPLFDDLAFKESAGFKDVEPGSVTLVVTREDGGQVLLRLPNIQLQPGQSLTLVLTHPSPTSNRVEAIQVVDELSTVAAAVPVEPIKP